jgi:hypothetical protein
MNTRVSWKKRVRAETAFDVFLSITFAVQRLDPSMFIPFVRTATAIELPKTRSHDKKTNTSI